MQSTVNYTYDGTWGDLLTAYDGNAIESDTIGNMLSDGTWTYTWEHGRELMSMSNGSTTWTFAYNADGLRTSRTNGSTTYSYVYNGSSLSQMTVGSNTLYFAYDASGTPMSVTYNGTNYYYATNLQGDVTAILDTSGTAVVQYTYDAWGKILTTTGDLASTLGAHNPLRYRAYVYDQETTLYYLQSRYYNPELGRFINADAFVSTGQGILGNNMFAYCGNNPISFTDNHGTSAAVALDESLKYLFALLATLDAATPFLEAAAIIGTVFAVGAIALNARQESERENAKPVADATTATQNSSDVVIYRYYASKTENLAPRPGKDYDGLSFSTRPPKAGTKAVKTTIGAINATGILEATLDNKAHVTVKPTRGTGNVSIWMAMGMNSPWSQVLSLIVVEIEG